VKSFSIHPKALDRIKDILRASNCREPVAVLADIANLDKYMKDVKRSILENVGKDEVTKIAMESYKSINEQLSYYLTVVVSEKETIEPEMLFTLEGVTFQMCSSIRESLNDYCLVFENNRFLFRNGNSIVHNMQSLG
jgi:hypothetical protein